MSLTVISVIEDIKEIEPAAMYEREAARYLKLSINELRKFVASGIIHARRHPGRKRRIYLKADLDRYLEKLPKEGVA